MGNIFWAIGYDMFSSAYTKDELMQEYLKHHEKGNNSKVKKIILLPKTKGAKLVKEILRFKLLFNHRS